MKQESRKVSGPAGRFTYIWDQSDYNPIDNNTLCHIHFKFSNGTYWRKAFTYDWRLYTPAEVRDALVAAGFSKVDIYWDHEPDPEKEEIYMITRRAENTPAWLAYLVAHG